MFEKTKAFFKAVKDKLTKTSDVLTSSIDKVFKSKIEIDEGVLEDLQESLILADVSFKSSERIIDSFRSKIKELESDEEINKSFYLTLLQKEIQSMLIRSDGGMNIDSEDLSIVMVSGVNGSGKTTTIGKLAYQYKQAVLSLGQLIPLELQQ